MTPLQLDTLAGISRPDFCFGTATASYQIEGHLPEQVPSIWDTFCAQTGAVADSSNGQYACMHIEHWREDLQQLKALGFDSYRFSIAWPKVIADERGTIIESGLRFYRDLLEECHRLCIRPVVTLYHWDLPQFLQDQGGWQERSTVEAFRHYMQVVMQRFGDLIDTVYTINEPWVIAFLGHHIGIHAPGIKDLRAAYRVTHHLLLAHGIACEWIRTHHPDIKVGIVVNGGPIDPASISKADIKAANFAYNELVDLFVRPVLLGEYPQILLDQHGDFLPEAWQLDMSQICQPLDRLGLNYYTRGRAEAGLNGRPQEQPVGLPQTEMGWEITPVGLYRWLNRLNKDYALPPIEITENGAACDDVLVAGQVVDPVRWQYLSDHIKAVDAAICDGINVCGYFVWSLMDNFEWAEGYRKRFGIIYIDYNTQQRVPKQSALMLKQSLRQRQSAIAKGDLNGRS